MKKMKLSLPRMVWIFGLFLPLLPFSAKAADMIAFCRYAAIFTRDGNPETSARILLGHYTKTINAEDTNDRAVLIRKKVVLALPAGSEKARALIKTNNCKWSAHIGEAVPSDVPVQPDIALHSFATTDAIPAFHSISGSNSASVDFQLAQGLIYMQASLNGSKPLWMMLDTGSSVTVFDESVSKRLGIPFRGEGKAYGPGQGSATKSAFARNSTLMFAGEDLEDQTVATLPLDWFSREVGRSTDGFLGSNVFRNYVVEIDYANQVLHLHDPATYSYSGSVHRLHLQSIWNAIPPPP